MKNIVHHLQQRGRIQFIFNLRKAGAKTSTNAVKPGCLLKHVRISSNETEVVIPLRGRPTLGRLNRVFNVEVLFSELNSRRNVTSPGNRFVITFTVEVEMLLGDSP